MQQGVEDFLVDKYSVKAGKVVKRVIHFYDLAQDPECFLFRQAEQ